MRTLCIFWTKFEAVCTEGFLFHTTIATHIPTLLFTTSATTTNHRMLRVFAKSTLLVKKCSRLVLKKPFIPRIYLYTMAIRHYFLIVIRSTHVMYPKP